MKKFGRLMGLGRSFGLLQISSNYINSHSQIRITYVQSTKLADGWFMTINDNN